MTLRSCCVLGMGLLLSACGQGAEEGDATSVSEAQALTGSGNTFTGSLIVSATTVKAGQSFTATETATNLTNANVYPVIVGIRRLGFTVLSSVKPRTGLCRIAGSATCNFLNLAPNETQSYTLTLVSNTPGTYQLQGWTTSQSIAGGSSTTVNITVQ